MMGNHSRSESLFYYFLLEGQVSENHLLRLIDRRANFLRKQWDYAQLKQFGPHAVPAPGTGIDVQQNVA